MLKVESDPIADSIYIYLSGSPVPVAYTKELDENRVIDYSFDDQCVGIGLVNVSEGVMTDDLPCQRDVEKFLEGMGIKTFA